MLVKTDKRETINISGKLPHRKVKKTAEMLFLSPRSETHENKYSLLTN